jgi:hypothetical protein
MKPTRNIVKPSGFWKTKGRVWYQKNDDDIPEKTKFCKYCGKETSNEYGCFNCRAPAIIAVAKHYSNGDDD